ncbi:hypothetical protein CKA32_006311 [Geitlerinema sp. FC II]|nr:hypothetical protein CKA32_006311 [Geitlerinema sp. FC II]
MSHDRTEPLKHNGSGTNRRCCRTLAPVERSSLAKFGNPEVI